MTFEVGTDKLFRNICNYQSTLCNIPKERRHYLCSGGSLKPSLFHTTGCCIFIYSFTNSFIHSFIHSPFPHPGYVFSETLTSSVRVKCWWNIREPSRYFSCCKWVLTYAMKTYGRVILDSCMFSFTFRPPSRRGEIGRYPMNRFLDGPPSRSGYLVEEKTVPTSESLTSILRFSSS